MTICGLGETHYTISRRKSKDYKHHSNTRAENLNVPRVSESGSMKNSPSTSPNRLIFELDALRTRFLYIQSPLDAISNKVHLNRGKHF